MVEDAEPPPFGPVTELVHGWRVELMGPRPITDTRQLILLAACAMLGYAIIGEGAAEALELTDEGVGSEAGFAACLAGLLVARDAAG